MKKPTPADLFSRPPLLIVRVTPRGLRILPTEETIEALEGHVISHGPRRKLFLEGILACHSDDAVTAKDGKRCQDCLHPLCRPQIRLRLATREAHYVLDLAVTSAKNLLALEEDLRAQGLRLMDVRLRLTVTARGHYGEVAFERLP